MERVYIERKENSMEQKKEETWRQTVLEQF